MTVSPRFSSVSPYNQPFSRYCKFYVFPLTLMLKFPALYGPVLISEIQSAKKVLICGGSPKKVTVCIPPSPLPDYHALYKFC